MFKKIFLFALISLSSASFAGLLHEAVERGDATEVALLITEGKDVNEQDDFGNTALYLAAFSGHVRVVQALLAAGADVNVQYRCWGKTALHLAAARGNLGVVKALLAAGADLTITNVVGQTPLQVATPDAMVVIQQWQQQQQVLVLPWTMPQLHVPIELEQTWNIMLPHLEMHPAIVTFLAILALGQPDYPAAGKDGRPIFLSLLLMQQTLEYLNINDVYIKKLPHKKPDDKGPGSAGGLGACSIRPI